MSILSIPATARLVERVVRNATDPVTVADVLRALDGFGVERRRAEAGLRLAALGQRVRLVEDADGTVFAVVPCERGGAR